MTIKKLKLDLLTTEEAAVMLGVSGSFLQKDRANYTYGIPHMKIGRSVRYKKEDIEYFIEHRYNGEFFLRAYEQSIN